MSFLGFEIPLPDNLPPNLTIGNADVSELYTYEESGSEGPPIVVVDVDLAKVIVSLLICVFGLIGNLLAIFVIVVLKEYQKSVTHWYVLHLAVADSIFLLTLPFSVSEDINGSWIFPDWMCKAKESILFLNYYASILFLVVMSFDRYIAVCHSFSTALQKLRKRRSSFIIAMSVWAFALLLCIPVILYSSKRGVHPHCTCSYAFPQPIRVPSECVDIDLEDSYETAICDQRTLHNYNRFYCIPLTAEFIEREEELILLSLRRLSNRTANDPGIPPAFDSNSGNSVEQMKADDPANDPSASHDDCNYWRTAEGFRIFIVLNFALMFLLPLVVMVWCYGLIVKKLSDTRVVTQTPSASFTQSNNVTTKISQKKKPSASRSDSDRRRVTIMCAALVSCFIACWLPFHSVHLAKIVGIRNTESETCVTLQIVGTLLAYLNSALNPYLYSFLGTNFARRWSSATVTLRQTVSRHRNSSSNSGSMRQVRKTADRKRRSTKTRITKVTGNHMDSSKHSVSEASPAFMEMTRPLASHSDTRNLSSSHYYTDPLAQDVTNDLSYNYKNNFSTTES